MEAFFLAKNGGAQSESGPLLGVIELGVADQFWPLNFHKLLWHKTWQNQNDNISKILRLISYSQKSYLKSLRSNEKEYIGLLQFICHSQDGLYVWASVRPRWLDIGQVLYLRVYGPRRSRSP